MQRIVPTETSRLKTTCNGNGELTPPCHLHPPKKLEKKRVILLYPHLGLGLTLPTQTSRSHSEWNYRCITVSNANTQTQTHAWAPTN